MKYRLRSRFHRAVAIFTVKHDDISSRRIVIRARQLIGLLAVALAACGGGSGSNAAPGPPGGPDLTPQNIVEALFLGSGPLSAGACPDLGVWSAFPRGTTVTVTVSTSVSADKRAAIRAALDRVLLATNGDIQTVYRETADPNPIPGLNEVTSTSHPSPGTEGCASDNGCTIPTFSSRGLLVSSRAVQPASQTVQAYVHDVVGHGILGLCHIDGQLIGGPARSLMSGGPGVSSGDIAGEPTQLDIDASIMVYASGLQPGASRSQFVQEGLVD